MCSTYLGLIYVARVYFMKGVYSFKVYFYFFPSRNCKSSNGEGGKTGSGTFQGELYTNKICYFVPPFFPSIYFSLSSYFGVGEGEDFLPNTPLFPFFLVLFYCTVLLHAEKNPERKRKKK